MLRVWQKTYIVRREGTVLHTEIKLKKEANRLEVYRDLQKQFLRTKVDFSNVREKKRKRESKIVSRTSLTKHSTCLSINVDA